MSDDVSSPARMRHGASTSPAERYIPVESSLLVALLALIPVLVLTTALGFLFKWWLLWAIPALLALVIWLLLLSRTIEAASHGMRAFQVASDMADDDAELVRSAGARAAELEYDTAIAPAGPSERAQRYLNERKSIMARAVEIVHGRRENSVARTAHDGGAEQRPEATAEQTANAKTARTWGRPVPLRSRSVPERPATAQREDSAHPVSDSESVTKFQVKPAQTAVPRKPGRPRLPARTTAKDPVVLEPADELQTPKKLASGE